MATEKVDGFRLDRIGQLLSTSYPELRLTPGLDGLVAAALRAGRAAAQRRTPPPRGRSGGRTGRKGRTPRGARPGERPLAARRPSRASQGRPTRPQARAARAVPPLGSAVDQARLGAALARLAAVPVERLLARPELPAAQALAARGPARPYDRRLPAPAARRAALRPGADHLQPVRRPRAARLRARPAVRARGRRRGPAGAAGAALPPGTVRTGVRVTVRRHDLGDHRGARRDSAAGPCCWRPDARAAAELLPGLRVPDFHPVTVVHHTADEPPPTGAVAAAGRRPRRARSRTPAVISAGRPVAAPRPAGP